MQDVVSAVIGFWDKYMFWINRPDVTVIDIIEILIIAVLFYQLLVWVKSTRAWALFRGIIVILFFVLLAALFQMNTILWIAEKTINVAVIAVLIIFQPEMRKALEQLGRRNILTKIFNFDTTKVSARYHEKNIMEMVKACYEMSKVKTGALIVLEQDVGLDEYARTGIALDSLLTSQLLINIFEKNTPLHDGAVIVQGERIVAATCYLPLSDNTRLSKDLGTRHRAAVGISEVSDSMTIVVSEETGRVSLAVDGRIYQNLREEELVARIRESGKLNMEPRKNFMQTWKRRLLYVKNSKRPSDK